MFCCVYRLHICMELELHRREHVDGSMWMGAFKWEHADGSVQMGAWGREYGDGRIFFDKLFSKLMIFDDIQLFTVA